MLSATDIFAIMAFLTSGTRNGLPAQRTAAADGRRGARPRSGGVQGQRAKIHGWDVSLGEHEEARRYRRPRHVGPRAIWRARLAGLRYGAGARGDREDLLCYRDGHPR